MKKREIPNIVPQRTETTHYGMRFTEMDVANDRPEVSLEDVILEKEWVEETKL